MVLFVDPRDVSIKPRHQAPPIRSFGRLPEMIRIARRLPVIVVLLVESGTREGYVLRLGMDRFMPHGGTKSIDHPAGTHHVRKGMEAVDPVKTHGDVGGDIHP